MSERSCAKCGTALSDAALACPACATLVYSTGLQRLAREATEAEAAGDTGTAVERWATALQYLPDGAGQRAQIEATITRLQSAPRPPSADDAIVQRRSTAWRKWLGGLAPALAILVTKGKFILLGLTKLPTLASMLVFVSVYWQRWGWAFALGFALSIYIHEMGHMLMFRRYGIASSLPLFLPGFGAVIFAKQQITDPRQDAHIGLAGPVAGLCAALVCLAVYAITGNALFLALTSLGALINLFNLLPILFLDGSRAMRGLNDTQRWIITGVAVGCSALFGSKLALGISLVMSARLLFWRKRESVFVADAPTFVTFAVLLVTLTGLATLDAPSPEQLRREQGVAMQVESAALR